MNKCHGILGPQNGSDVPSALGLVLLTSVPPLRSPGDGPYISCFVDQNFGNSTVTNKHKAFIKHVGCLKNRVSTCAQTLKSTNISVLKKFAKFQKHVNKNL